MNVLDRVIAAFAPEAGVRRAQARHALTVLANYSAATTTGRGSSWWKARNSDADAAAGRRGKLRDISRDMIRNTPLATRAQMVIANNVVGDGIIPKVAARNKATQRGLQQLVERHLDTVAIDADGRANLYGLQRLAMNACIDAGEVLLRRRRRRVEDGLPLPFQVQILEADYLDTTKEGEADGGGYIREGIERDAIGRRVAYWLYDEHPGTSAYRPRGLQSRRVPARDIIHLYRQDRPGQLRGVTWFAPIALNLQDLADGIDAHLMRQKIAACFAAFRVRLDADPTTGATVEDKLESIRPGRIQTLGPGEDVRFSAPPAVEGFDEFNKVILRMVAGGLGITYESLSGDLSNVNFSSARMGRMEMNRNVSAWQHLMMVPQMMDPLGQWFLEAAALQAGRSFGPDVRLTWVPPPPVLVDPAKEIAAAREAVLAGFKSRQQVIREQGFDPERVLEEQKEDAAAADLAGLVFDSDARVGRVAPAVTSPAQQEPGDQNTGDQNE